MAYILFLKEGQVSKDELIQEVKSNDRGLFYLQQNREIRHRFSFNISSLEIEVDEIPTRSELLECRSFFSAKKIDVLVIQSYINPTLPNIFCFDMDSTVIQQEVIDELARKHGVFEEVASVTKQAMDGGMQFDEALKLRVKHLKGLSRVSFEEVYSLLTLNPGMDMVFQELPSKNTKIMILSGGFTPVLELFAKKYPIHFFRANGLEEKDAAFTGEVLGEIINKEKKAIYLESKSKELKIPNQQIVAVGDGANDGAMLQKAAIGVGFHAKQGLKDQIVNWLDFCDMSALLFLFR